MLDLGMVGHVAPGMQDNLLHLLIAISEGKGDDASNVIAAMSETTEDFDAAAFDKRLGHLLGESKNQGLQKMNVGKTLLAVTKTAASAGLVVPSELTVQGFSIFVGDQKRKPKSV